METPAKNVSVVFDLYLPSVTEKMDFYQKIMNSTQHFFENLTYYFQHDVINQN